MRVLVVGAGGLGGPALLGLASWDLPLEVDLLDPDRVELSNLHRQILYGEADLGRPKAEVAAERMARWGLAVRPRVDAFRPGGFDLSGYDLVLDGVDRFEVKAELADAARQARVPHVFASAVGVSGQVLAIAAGGRPCLHCAFPEPPTAAGGATCATDGVLGPVVGRVAAEQVSQARALVQGQASHRLWMYDGMANQALSVRVSARPDCVCARDVGRHVGAAPAREPDPAWSEAPQVDLRGRVCPQTYVETRKVLERMPVGARLWVVFTSDESARNVPRSAVAAGHRLLWSEQDQGVHRVLLERGA